MNNNELFNSLRDLNNAQRGSLGEFIYYHESLKQGLKVESLHEQRVDFVINGTIQIDVKTSFATEGAELKHTPIGMYSAHRYEDIKYALVELFSDGIRISIDGSLFSEINLDEVKNYWESWKKIKQKENQNNIKKVTNLPLNLSEMKSSSFSRKTTPCLLELFTVQYSKDLEKKALTILPPN